MQPSGQTLSGPQPGGTGASPSPVHARPATVTRMPCPRTVPVSPKTGSRKICLGRSPFSYKTWSRARSGSRKIRLVQDPGARRFVVPTECGAKNGCVIDQGWPACPCQQHGSNPGPPIAMRCRCQPRSANIQALGHVALVVRMPLQNRVDPFGDIRAIPRRGMFTGNRGIIHDPATKTLMRKRWSSKAWLVCSCDYKGVRRAVMARRSWTELFFLDEATALAAGHRPCFACRRPAAEQFRAAWARGSRCDLPAASRMDAVLHAERLDGRKKRLHPLDVAPGGSLPLDVVLSDLPDGTMLAAGPASFVVRRGRVFAWSPDGYRVADRVTIFDGLLTPPSTVACLKAGYRPMLHPSLEHVT